MGNKQTVLAYEGYARTYAERTAGLPTGVAKEALDILAGRVGRGGTILEIGSGPGWDADYVESLGVSVRRTDVTEAFIGVQAARGKRVERLDLTKDELGGPYTGVMAIAVLQHVERKGVDAVLRRIAAALTLGGTFLFSVPEGEEERQEGKAKDYYVSQWTAETMQPRLAAAGLAIEWVGSTEHKEGPWLTFVARRPSAAEQGR